MFVILLTPSGVAATTMGMGAIVFGLIGIFVGLFLLWLLVFLIAIPGLTILCSLCAAQTGRRYLVSLLGSLLRVPLVLLPFAAFAAAILYYLDEVADTDWFEVDKIAPWLGPALIGLIGLALLFAMLVFVRCAWRAGKAAGTAIVSEAAAHPERGLFVFRNATTFVILCPLAFAAIPMGLSLGIFLVTDLDQSWLDYVNFSVPALAVYSLVFLFAMRRGLAKALPAAGTNLTERLLDLARHRFGEAVAGAGAVSPRAAYAALFVAPLLMFVPGVAGVAGGTWALRNTGGPYEQWHFRNVSSACFHALIVAVLLVATYMTFVPAADSNWGYLALVPLAAAGGIAWGIRADLRLGLAALRTADRV